MLPVKVFQNIWKMIENRAVASNLTLSSRKEGMIPDSLKVWKQLSFWDKAIFIPSSVWDMEPLSWWSNTSQR
jgi:hypothetical protein